VYANVDITPEKVNDSKKTKQLVGYIFASFINSKVRKIGEKITS